MQKIKLMNTLRRKKEELKPLEDGHVRIYACGGDRIRSLPHRACYASFGLRSVSQFSAVQLADEIRDTLHAKGIDVQDNPDSTAWSLLD